MEKGKREKTKRGGGGKKRGSTPPLFIISRLIEGREEGKKISEGEKEKNKKEWDHHFLTPSARRTKKEKGGKSLWGGDPVLIFLPPLSQQLRHWEKKRGGKEELVGKEKGERKRLDRHQFIYMDAGLLDGRGENLQGRKEKKKQSLPYLTAS